MAYFISMGPDPIGGTSDCRNRRLQKMFQLVGYGDHAGSGLPKIYHNWAGQHWRRPVLHELPEPEQTQMELRMASLLPAQAVAELERHLGARVSALSSSERLALVTALVTAITEGVLNHARLREISTEHPTDISKMLARLVKEGLLVSDGVGRGMVYFLPWQDRRVVTLFEGDSVSSAPLDLGALTPELSGLTPELENLPSGIAAQVISDLNQLSEADIALLRQKAAPVSERLRAEPELVRRTVLALCAGRYLGLRVLAELLNRYDSKDLRTRILNPLVAEGALMRAYPKANDPRQAYISHSTSATNKSQPA